VESLEQVCFQRTSRESFAGLSPIQTNEHEFGNGMTERKNHCYTFPIHLL